MFSVTERINQISQPHGGYVNPRTFKVTPIHDGKHVFNILPNYRHIQGLAVDYLTRFMSGRPKEYAFIISLLGAGEVSETDNAKRLLNSIKGLDAKSIYSACQLVGYDIAFRRGSKYFSPVELITPDDNVINNIILMVQRSLVFLQKYGPAVKEGFTFEGGYTEVVSSGDGDYLTSDTLWDFKASQYPPTSNNTLQLLMYYILGFHSVHDEFQYIKKIGIFNPELNTVYELELSEIPDRIFHDISHDVLGYRVSDNPVHWRLAYETDKAILLEAIKLVLDDNFKDTGFNPDRYNDGIYDITPDDYWSYYRDKSQQHRPKFTHTESIKFLKHDGFIMFISVSKSGSMCILQGGTRRRVSYPIEYYYTRLPEYGHQVLGKFHQYWDALYSISKQLQSIAPSKEMLKKREYAEYSYDCWAAEIPCVDFEHWYETHSDYQGFSGRIHGCIIDLDYFNHIYLNPFDGKLVPYYATSIYQKYPYKNVASLIADRMPDMLPCFRQAISDSSYSLIKANATEKHVLAIMSNSELSTYDAVVTDIKMYDVSRKMKGLQSIYDYHLVEVWYDNFLSHIEVENRQANPKDSLVGQSKRMQCGVTATVIEDFGPSNLSVQFEDGHIVKYCRREDFQKGKIKNKPKIKNK